MLYIIGISSTTPLRSVCCSDDNSRLVYFESNSSGDKYMLQCILYYSSKHDCRQFVIESYSFVCNIKRHYSEWVSKCNITDDDDDTELLWIELFNQGITPDSISYCECDVNRKRESLGAKLQWPVT